MYVCGEKRDLFLFLCVHVHTGLCVRRRTTACSCLCLLCGMCLVLSVHACECVHRERTSPLSKWIVLQSVPPFLRSCHLYADRHIHRQADRRVGWAAGRGVGGDRLNWLAPLKVMSCLKLRTDDCRHNRKICQSSGEKITIVFTCGHFSV